MTIAVYAWNGSLIRQTTESIVISQITIPQNYINATEMCRANNRLWGHYAECASTKEYLRGLALDLGESIDEIVVAIKGVGIEQGTWVHPLVGIDLSRWLGIKFYFWYISALSGKSAAVVLRDTANQMLSEASLFDSGMPTIAKTHKKHLEKDVRIQLAEQEKGQAEVETPVGNIDVVTNSEIIEIKEYSKWKSAIGQIISYGVFFPKKSRRIHLFGNMGRVNLEKINYVCNQLNIRLTYE